MGSVQPFHVEKDRGEAIWFLGGLTYVKASSEMTAGAFSLLDQILPPRFATPYHLHHREDEAFYLLEGEATFICAGKKICAGPGDFLFGPREIPHGFRVEGQSPARILVSTTPAGFERFVIEVGEPATSPILPEPAQPDMPRLAALAAKYQIDILGPLPE